MEPHHHQKNRENDVEKPIELALASPSSPPSSTSSSPSHEFSFTISHHSFSTPFPGKSKSPPSLALDLSPADEIFFHGHLLPLQILSHFPASSPRSSTNSNDSFILPIRELLQSHQNPTKDSASNSSSSSSNNITSDSNNSSKRERENNNFGTKKVDGKSKFAFSFFPLTKEHKGCHVKDKEDKEKNKKKFDVIHAVKKYLRMVKPLRIFRGRRDKVRLQGKSYSYSGNVTPRSKQELRGWRGQFSAPASMRTSPSNSGPLLATTTFSPPSDSTMEELQAAIQAAIAHCKNSYAKEDKLNC